MEGTLIVGKRGRKNSDKDVGETGAAPTLEKTRWDAPLESIENGVNEVPDRDEIDELEWLLLPLPRTNL